MATDLNFVSYIVEQINGVGAVRYKKMFGEYMIYVNEKPILLVCDNTAFVKILPCIEELMKNSEKGYPYNGAKEHYVLDVDNAVFAKEVITALEPAIPLPKPKKSTK